MNRKILTYSGLGIAIVLLLAINMLSNVAFKSARIDLTENKLFTLSDGTKNILKNLDEPITLRFFYSEKLGSAAPGLMNYAHRVRELLEEYANHSNGKVKLIVVDPEPFSDEEDQAVQYGLQGVPVDNAGSVVYFGLAGTNSTEGKETIPFFQADKEESLEYDVTKLVYNLANPKKQTIGLMSDLPIEGGPPSPFMQMAAQDQPWMIVNVLKQSYDVRDIKTDAAEIPKDIDVLMMVHPKNLSDETLFAIDQFVLRGGRIIAFVDPFSEADTPASDPKNPMAAMTAPRNSNLQKLFDKWGVQLANGEIATDINSATRVTVNNRMRPQAIDYVAWLTLKPSNLDHKDFVTADLKQINMATPGYFTKKDGAETQITPLIETSPQAMQVAESKFQFSPNPAALLSDYHPGGKKLMLAVRISGKVKTAFPDGAPKSKDENKKDPAGKTDFLKESKEPVNIIAVADTDMLSDKFLVDVQNFFGQRVAVPRSNNGVFVVNAIDNLSGSNDLISLRSRGKFSRPFEKVQDIQRDAEKRFHDEEKQLKAKLSDMERKINDLQSKKVGSSALMLSPEQQSEIDRFRSEQVKTRKELRNVQHELRKNIENLGTDLKFINIGLIPFMVILVAIGLGVYRHKRMKV